MSVPRLLGGLTGAAASVLLVTTGVCAPAHADDVDAIGDELNGNTATLHLGAICPGASRSGTVGFELERRGNGATVLAGIRITAQIRPTTRRACNERTLPAGKPRA